MRDQPIPKPRCGWCARVVGALAVVALSSLLDAQADGQGVDIRAPTMAHVGEVLAPYLGSTAGQDPAVTQALNTLRKKDLLRPPAAVTDTSAGLVDQLGAALLLGNRAKQFLPQLATLNDDLSRGNDQASRADIAALWQKAGRAAPASADLDRMLKAAYAANGSAAPPSQHVSLSGPDGEIRIDDAPAAGQTQIDVTQIGPDGKPQRVTFSGASVTSATANGGLQQNVQPDPSRTVTQDQSDAMHDAVLGVWTSQNGETWEIAGTGATIVATETYLNGHKVIFNGQWALGRIVALHPIDNIDDMDDTLPPDVRASLANDYHPPFTIRLEYFPDKRTLKGVWISGQVTFSGLMHVVKVIADPTWDKPLVLVRAMRPGYHIAKVVIDYSPWQEERLRTSSEVRFAQELVKDRTHEFIAARDRFEQKATLAKAAQTALLAARQAAIAAETAAANVTLDDSAKTPDYRHKEAAVDDTANRLVRLQTLINDQLADAGTVPNETLDRAEALQQKFDAQQADLDLAATVLGLDRKRAAAKTAADQADKARWQSERDYLSAAAVADGARQGLTDTSDLLEMANEAEEAAVKARDKLFAQNEPFITYVEATAQDIGVFRARWWDPRDGLAALDAEIEKAQTALIETAEARMTARGEFMYTETMVLADGRDLEAGIDASKWFQFSTELGFSAYEVIKKTREAGPAGALSELGKNFVEFCVKPPSFTEPADIGLYGAPKEPISAFQDFLDITQERAIKNASSDPAADAALAAYLANRDWRTYIGAVKEAIVGHAEGRGPIVNGPKLMTAFEAFEKYKVARTELKRKIADFIYVNTLKDTVKGLKTSAYAGIKGFLTSPQAKKFAADMAKDVAKEAIKRLIAEYFEGGPMSNYLRDEWVAEAYAFQFQAASANYWKTLDEYEEYRKARAALLRGYDPNTQLQTTQSDDFHEGDTVRIDFTDLDMHLIRTGQRHFDVLLGGKPMQEDGGDFVTFSIKAKDLESDSTGGVVLAITANP